jgi:phosphopantetheinyl transferase (holo-ACP synthase)
VADPASRIRGIGIDIEERTALARFDGVALRRAAARWLTEHERRWCDRQTVLAEAIAVVLCCKEAVFKAWSGTGAMHDVRLSLYGALASGRGRANQSGVSVQVRWRRRQGQVVAVAVAAEGTDTPVRDLQTF